MRHWAGKYWGTRGITRMLGDNMDEIRSDAALLGYWDRPMEPVSGVERRRKSERFQGRQG